MPGYATGLSPWRDMWFWPGRQGSTGTDIPIVLTFHLWCLEAPNPPKRKQEKDFAWTDPELIQNRQLWNLESAPWSGSLYSQPWLHMAAPPFPHLRTVLLLMVVHIPAEVAGCCRSIPTVSVGKGKPRDPNLLGKKPPKVGDFTQTEGYTDSVHPLWRSYQGNSFPYDLFWESQSPKKAARYLHKQVSYSKKQQTAGLRSSSYIRGYTINRFCLISRGWIWMVRQNIVFNHPRKCWRIFSEGFL